MNTQTTQRLRRWVLGAALAGLLAGQAVPALAHYIYTAEVYTYKSSTTCQDQRVEISHGNGYGYSKTNGYSTKRGLSPWGFEDCFINNSVGAGNLRALNQLWVKGSSGWLFCNGRGYSYNTSTTHSVQQSYYWAASQSTSLCGSNKYYRTMGYTHHYYGTSWRGGPSTSGATGHLLPV